MVARKATDEEIIQALQGRTVVEAAAVLGMHERVVYSHKARLARQGWSPAHDMTKTVPDGYKVKGVSTFYDQDGKPRGQWVKSTIDEDRQRELFEASCKAAVKDLPVVVPKKAKGEYLDHLLTCYPIGDPHFGEYIWGDECGKDWDLTIAERVHCGAMASLVSAAPAT